MNNTAANPNFRTYATQADFTAAGADPRDISQGWGTFGIAVDTFAGRPTLRSNRRRNDPFTAREIGELCGKDENGFTVAWEFSGHVQGQALYCRVRYAVLPGGGLAQYTSEGVAIAMYPADRVITIMTR